MENIPERDMNPPEERENPRCPECDVEMERVDTWTFGLGKIFECHEPICSECAKKYRKVAEEE